MQVIDGADAGLTMEKPVVAIGNFDGVHQGHVALIKRAIDRAAAIAGHSVALTFSPHPAKVLAPELAPPLLCTRSRKLELLAELGLSATVVHPFNKPLAALSAQEFVSELLVKQLAVAELVVGYDFTFGNRRKGTTETLREAGQQHGFVVHVLDAVTVNGLVASSTKIREFVHEGNVKGATVLLGRNFDVTGVVKKGAGRGRTIGIPTANVHTDNELLPRSGVYAAWVADLAAGPNRHPAAVNIGTNPTFTNDGVLSLEAHLLDFDGDLLGQDLRVAFVDRIRDEARFASADELVAQIHKDITTARHML